MRDSYLRFFSKGYISKDQFFEFGLKETIYSPFDKAEMLWEQLKKKIFNDKEVYIRGFGRDSSGTHLFQEFYIHLVGNSQVKKDPTNNKEPTKIIRDLTGYSKTKSATHEAIRNYQVSHIFGRTKNVFTFTAPWNIVYMPKMLDPFTGHEAKGELIDEYTEQFHKQGYLKFKPLIDDYNTLVSENKFIEKIEHTLNTMGSNSSYTKKDIEKLRKSVKEEFTPIIVNA